MPEPGSDVVEARSALVKVKIGGREYDAVRNPQCNTCMHPARAEIEKRLLSGHSYRDIADHYSNTEYTVGGETRVFPRVGFMSIRNHFQQGHMPVEAAALRRVLDERTRELSEHYEEETSRIVDGYGFAKQVLLRSQEELTTGSLRPTIQDGLAAAKLIAELEAAAGGSVDAEIWAQAMTRYFEILRDMLPDDLWEAYAARLTTDPVLRSIQKRVEGVSDPDALDAEFTEGEEPA
jgi:hypothetical protein